MIALQTVMPCQYRLFFYYKLLPFVPFCHDLLGKHRKQGSAAEVCGYEVFGGGGEAPILLAVLVLRKWKQLKETPTGCCGKRIKSILQVYVGFSTLML